MEKQVTYTEVEADALISQAKKLAKGSGRTVRAEAELLLSRDRQTRLRDLRRKVGEAGELLAAISVEVDGLRAESGDDDGELAALIATMTVFCEPFASVPARGSRSTTAPAELPVSSTGIDLPRLIESDEGPLP